MYYQRPPTFAYAVMAALFDGVLLAFGRWCPDTGKQERPVAGISPQEVSTTAMTRRTGTGHKRFGGHERPADATGSAGMGTSPEVVDRVPPSTSSWKSRTSFARGAPAALAGSWSPPSHL